MFECSDSMSYYGQETTCMVTIVIGKFDYSYLLEFGNSFIVGAKPHSYASLVFSPKTTIFVINYRAAELWGFAPTMKNEYPNSKKYE